MIIQADTGPPCRFLPLQRPPGGPVRLNLCVRPSRRCRDTKRRECRRRSFLGGLPVRRTLFLMVSIAATAAWAAEPPREPPVIARPEAFGTLVHPNCSHCLVEAKRRKD